MVMPEYTQPRLEKAKRHEDDAAEHVAAALHAHHTSGTYVLFTDLFAMVLFFGGLSAMIEWLRLRIIILSLALVLFVVTLGFLTAMPICHE
jgi:hypothetical protein